MDPQQQQQLAGVMAGFGAVVGLIWLVALAFLVFLFWRIFVKAGMAGPLGLIALIPGFGLFICLCILAFGQWRNGAATLPYARDAVPYPPAYPPGTYPPASYPPSDPPAGV